MKTDNFHTFNYFISTTIFNGIYKQHTYNKYSQEKAKLKIFLLMKNYRIFQNNKLSLNSKISHAIVNFRLLKEALVLNQNVKRRQIEEMANLSPSSILT